ncbi:MAG: hypothetical protein Q8R00_02065 [Candidatus Nanoarchaeia archaeon]|nr:hypothetical protein [Candidatus Nanoarchaeia archaeon]
MTNVTLEEVNKNVLELKREIEEIRSFLNEDFELAEDVKKEIEESRKRSDSEFISNENIQFN